MGACVESSYTVGKTTVYITIVFQKRVRKRGRSLMKMTVALVPVRKEGWRKKRKGTNQKLMERLSTFLLHTFVLI